MRALADRERIEQFMQALARHTDEDTRVYFTGGATAVLYGWRGSTIDVDLKLVPERDSLLRGIASLKDRLHVNVELASPLEFIPVSRHWEDRSPFIRQIDRVFFHHFDPYAQALAKIERGHRQDLEDVEAMFRLGLVEAEALKSYFTEIESELYRYPAVDPRSFRDGVAAFVKERQGTPKQPRSSGTSQRA